MVTSAVVEAEIEPAPEKVRLFFANYSTSANIVDVSEEALGLRLNYFQLEVVNEESLDDALHVAVATVSGCDLIVSWNFRHIVHFDKISKYNAVNRLSGHGRIGIFSPSQVIQYGNS